MAIVLALSGCLAGPARAPRLPDAMLVPASPPGPPVRLSALVGRSRFTVIEMFSSQCACQRAHDPRLRDLAVRYQAQGVQLVAVDPEVGVTSADDAAEARSRGYVYPILLDRDARVAEALGAESATYVALVDDHGNILYRGGIDSDHSTLTADATPYLENAIRAVLAGRTPERLETRALGCTLRTR